MKAKNNPIADPRSFAHAYGAEFGAVVDNAAGRDGRLSKNEARELTDGWQSGTFGKPVRDFFDATLQDSVGVARITKIATRRAQNAAAAATRGGRIDPKRLPKDLAPVFLRFEKTVPARAGDLSVDALRTKAEQFLEEKLAPSRGWTDVDLHDVYDATNDWALSLKFGLYHNNDQIDDEDLIKIDFHGGYGDPDSGKGFSVGIAMDRRTGEVLKLYVGREPPIDPSEL